MIGLFLLLPLLAVALAGSGANAQSPVPAVEPQSVGPVTNLAISTDGQESGAVRLSWSEAENAQVHFVVYVKSAELTAGNYGSAQMAPFAGSEGVVSGLEGGTSYHFIVIGMRWNWVNYGTVWGSWSDWMSATPQQTSPPPQLTPATDRAAPAGTAASDRAAMIALYNSMGGPHWTNNANWLSDKPTGDWYGITTDNRGRIIRISLHYNGLNGEIPLQFGDLDALEGLELNGIDGDNPDLSALSDLPNLRYLSLYQNGIFDLSALTGLPRLETLDLRINRISDQQDFRCLASANSAK